MKYLLVYLWSSPSIRIIDLMKSFENGFSIRSIKNCKLEMNTYADLVCKTAINYEYNKIYKAADMNEILVTVDTHLSYILFNTDGERRMIVLYYLPQKVVDSPINYHKWIWNQETPGLILMPNISNNEKYYLPINFKHVTIVPHTKVKYYTLKDTKQLYINPEITYKFAISKGDRPPITIYDSDKNIICGQDIINKKYLHVSKILDFNQTYFITCNDLISYKTNPLVRILINVFKGKQVIYTDYIIYRIAPIILTPNNLPVEKVYLANLKGAQNNQQFLLDVEDVLKKTDHDYVVVDNSNISMYHRWMQDIFKFGYCTDGINVQYVVLKGPHFLTHTQAGVDMSYIYDYFKGLPIYSFDFSSDRNLDAFGNVQIIPPIEPNYPLGRIIYGISDEESQANISYNLMAFLENQQVQKPIKVNTGWLSVGHVDEILSYIPDPSHRLGFRVLIASTNKFYELIKKLKKDQLIFDDKNIYYIIEQHKAKHLPYEHKYDIDDKYQCIYNTKIMASDLLNWDELIIDNQLYQKKLDNIKAIVGKELGLEDDEFYEIPIYYWPKSIANRAKSIMPNMVNNLYVDGNLLVPKPFGPQRDDIDIFERYFKSCIPKSVKVNFIKNWDCYYLLEGDINCATNTLRKPFNKAWWQSKYICAYDV